MDIRHELEVECSTERLLAWVDDLSNYPPWMGLVHRVETMADDPDGAAWGVELRARVGPFARSKRLRMVRIDHDRRHAVFERRELDGRSHAPWVLRAEVTPATASADAIQRSVLTMRLHYGGNLFTGAVMHRVLDEAVRRGSSALAEVVSREPTH